MKLFGYVRDKETKNVSMIESDDYNSKAAFAQDLRGNGFAVISVKNLRDQYVIAHTDFRTFSELKKEIGKDELLTNANEKRVYNDALAIAIR